ncbi:ABC transporter substrate-binding protein [Lacrimispora sp.]|uniref:ABC transporter substrate-binding protein n=1 Tax=Lacrimispora sp. TaxID=2719234 RepID=UPI0028ADE549|nr:ABC transporter substrate-binding protein [Lacrimispora sp.]
MKSVKLTVASLLAGVLLLGSITGCSQKAVQTEPTSSAAAVTSEAASSEAVTAESAADAERTITDMAGRTVTIPAQVEKIGTFGSVGVLNAFVELMGDGSKICNDMPENFTKNDSWKLQYEFAPQIKGAPLFEANKEIAMETVLATKPDVCFTMTKETAELLEKNGISAVYLAWSEIDDVKKAVSLMGEVLNKQETADDYIKYFDEKLARAQELTKDITDKKTVLYGSVTTLTQPHKIAEWWIAQAGGISVTDDGRKEDTLTYTLEDLLKWNPQVMILTAKSQIAEIEADSRFANITAVKDNALYVTPTVAHVWGNRTVEQPLTIFWAMNKLYPEIMSRDELSKEIKYFYSHFFLYEMSDAQVSEIIDGK